MQLTRYKLGDLIVQRREKNEGYDVPIRGVSREGFIKPKQQEADTSIYNVFYRNDFVFNPARMELNSIALNLEFDKALCSSLYEIFYVKDESIVLPEFLNLHIKRDEFARHCEYIGSGSAREYCRVAQISEFDIDLPPIDVQQKIVDANRLLVKRIETNKKLIATLEQTAQTLYRHTFIDNIDPNNLPEGWRMGTVEEMSEKIIAGVIPKYNEKSLFAVLGQKCIRNHSVDLDLVKHHDPKENCEYLKYGDILINSTGDGTLGRSGQVLFAPDKLAFDSNMTLVRPLKEHYIEYLGHLIFGKQDYFVRISQGSTNQTRLYCSMVRPVELVIPTEDVLDSFSKKVRCMNSLIHAKRMEIKNLLKMQTLLLSKMGC